MAQWMGQYTGHTHLSKIQDREEQLRHAIDVYRSKTTTLEQKTHSKYVVRFADRLLQARIRAAKSHVAALDPRDGRVRELTERKIVQMVQTGTNAILDEFDAIDILFNRVIAPGNGTDR